MQQTIYNRPDSSRAIAIWLFVCCVMVFCMVLVGGLTRLTDSGLSMTDWHPIHGVIPPIGEAEWQEEFDAYRQFPEYQKINKGMSLDEFKNIFWLEYYHRILGRLTGFVFFIPFLWFAVRRRLNTSLSIKLFGMFCLGGLQGLIGWYMVKSGLVDKPDVSQYRLTLHLSMAFLLFALLYWTALSLWHKHTPKLNLSTKWFRWGVATTLLLFLQIMVGGFVAGLDAGHIYNEYPLMGGEFVPGEIGFMQPWWKNIFENAATVQFIHRTLALIVLLGTVLFAVVSMKKCNHKRITHASIWVLIAISVQFVLGIKTLLYGVPIGLASAHQMVALLLFMSVLNLLFKLKN